MQRTALVVFTLALVAGSGSAAGLDDVRFSPPAQVGPSVGIEGSQWLLVVFSNMTAGAGVARLPEASLQEEFHDATVKYREDTFSTEFPAYVPAPGLSSQLPPLEAALSFTGLGPGSLYIEAENLSWSYQGAETSLDRKPDGICLMPFVGLDRFRERAARYDELCPPVSVHLLTPANLNATPTFSLKASGVEVLEWHNAAVQCVGTDQCPGGGAREEETEQVGTITLQRRFLDFRRLTTTGAELEFSGSAVALVGGGPVLDLAINGQARLPLASASAACPGCAAPADQTMALAGNFSLTGIAIQPDGWLAGRVEGDVRSLRFDETSMDPATVFGVGAAVATAATVGLVLLLKPLLAAMFTKMRSDNALLNKSRRAIHDYIQQFPGTTLREIRRGTGLASGTVQKHMRALKETGHVIEQRHGATRRFFPPGQDSTAKRTQIILLREKPLGQLFELVRRNPWLSQGDFMNLARRELDWSRSTTQHRLGRLVRGGLVAVRKQGRFKLHAVAETDSSFRVRIGLFPHATPSSQYA